MVRTSEAEPEEPHEPSAPGDSQRLVQPSGAWSADARGSSATVQRTSGIPPAQSQRYGAGDVVGDNYRLIRLLGRGGMGDVWLARNETLDVEVAIKLIRGAVDTLEAEDRLLQEARAAAKIEHPAIVRVFDFGRTPLGDPFIVMERLEGEDLATTIYRRGRLAPVHAVRTLLPIVHALSVAHAKGVVHRDLKPENVFLAKTPGDRLEPKIVDFGVAKIDQGSNLRLTREGDVLGSPAYMSPEQARGEDTDHGADLWALCVVLYEAIEGRRPFAGANHHAVLHAITRGELVVPVLLTAPVASPDDEALWSILSSGLHRDPAQRFRTARALGEALAGWLLACGIAEDISGASLEAVWARPPEADIEPSSPLPSVPPRSSETTVRRRSVAPRREMGGGERSQRNPRRLAVSAMVLLVGVGLAVYLSSAGTRAHAGAVPAGVGPVAPAIEPGMKPSSGWVTPAVSEARAHRDIPVETLDEIPIDREDAPAAGKGKLPRSRSMPVSAPRPLKDPFQ